MRPPLLAPSRANQAVAFIILNTLSFCPTPEITVKFHDWLNMKEIKAKSLQISNYQMKLLLFHFFFNPLSYLELPSAYADWLGSFGAWPSTVGTDSWQKTGRAVCVMAGRPAGG